MTDDVPEHVSSPAAGKVRVVVADDDRAFRELLCEVLESDDRLEVVGEATNGAAILALASEVEPDVVAMDIVMPLVDGIEATRRIRSSHPGCRVVLMSGMKFQDDLQAGAEAAASAGASAFVLKSAALLEVAETVYAAARSPAPAVGSTAGGAP